MVCHCNETHLGSRSAATRGAGSSTPSTQSTPGMKDARARRANSSPHSCTNYCEMRASTGTSHPVKPTAPTRRCDGREFGTYVHALSHGHEDGSGHGCHKPQHHFLCLRGQLIERDWARQQTRRPAFSSAHARAAPPHIALSLQREAHKVRGIDTQQDRIEARDAVRARKPARTPRAVTSCGSDSCTRKCI